MVLAIQKAKTEGNHLKPEFRDEFEPPTTSPLKEKKVQAWMVALWKQKQKDGCKFKASLFYKRMSQNKNRSKTKKQTNNNKTDSRDWQKGIRRKSIEMERGNS